MSIEPQCPQCGAANGQARLTVSGLDKIKLDLRGEAAAHFDTAHKCGVCGSPYLFRSGVSCALTATRPDSQTSASWPATSEQN